MSDVGGAVFHIWRYDIVMLIRYTALVYSGQFQTLRIVFRGILCVLKPLQHESYCMPQLPKGNKVYSQYLKH